ncbi:MAG: ATP-binding cassette domain-containing protein [candidate division Zixibacteria bacterium]|nr:ATP-binding cassette domain-containing protein [candidate division Zixibacteria bacterium]
MPDSIIELRNVSGKKLRNINLPIFREEKVVILGPSGSGKSTLLRYINLLEEPESGEVIFDGKPAGDYYYPDIRKRAVLLPQLPVVVDGTVVDNLKWTHSFGSEPDCGDDFKACLDVVGIAHLASSPASQLSGGEKQRLNLAMGFSLNPQVMLLDEPTSALDPASSRAVHSAINRMARKGVGFVIVTHSYNEALLLADKVGIIIDGQLKQLGLKDDVLNNPVNGVREFLESHKDNNGSGSS